MKCAFADPTECVTFDLHVRLLVYFTLRPAQEGGSSRDRPRRGELREREAGRIS